MFCAQNNDQLSRSSTIGLHDVGNLEGVSVESHTKWHKTDHDRSSMRPFFHDVRHQKRVMRQEQK